MLEKHDNAKKDSGRKITSDCVIVDFILSAMGSHDVCWEG